MLADRVRMCAKSKVEETIEIPFTITLSFAASAGGGGGGGTTIRSNGQITFNGDEVFVWDITRLSSTTYVSNFWVDSLMADFYNETYGIITSTQQEGISNIFSTGFDEGFAVGVYQFFDSIYIYDAPSIVSSGRVTLNNEITVTGVFIV